MFNYTEKSRLYPATKRLIYILDGAQKVGRIVVYTDLSGNLVPRDCWKKERPILVEYIDPKRSRERGYDDTYHINYCRTVAEGKKIFADWYAENKAIFRRPKSEQIISVAHSIYLSCKHPEERRQSP